jgi:tRNA nucleotidyltransferase (CCA-adding enzyme)
MSGFIIPNQISSFLCCLENAGYQAYIVGGCVRDGLLGMAPHDWDVCTDALPQEIQSLFQDTLNYGMKHGTVTVKWQKLQIEVTTFRAESSYSDHRRPDQVKFIHDLRADLSRRDFTVNAMAMDAAGVLHDPFGGTDDLRAGVIRAVGNPKARFDEDALRMLRAYRFSAQLGFHLERNTEDAIQMCAPLSVNLAPERVRAEIEKTLLTSHPDRIAGMISSALLTHWKIFEMKEPAAKLKCVAPDRIKRWCAFCLLTGQTDFLKPLRLDRNTVEACEICTDIRKTAPRDALFWKGAIHQHGADRALNAAEIISALDQTFDLQLVDSILSSGECCTISELAIRGQDVAELGFCGKEIGDALTESLHLVWQHPHLNQKEALLHYLREEKRHG